MIGIFRKNIDYLTLLRQIYFSAGLEYKVREINNEQLTQEGMQTILASVLKRENQKINAEQEKLLD
jgi:hypothetical protein